MEQSKKAWIAVTSIILFFAIVYLGKRQFLRQLEAKTHPFEVALQKIEKAGKPEWCDTQFRDRRLLVARVLDRHKDSIEKLRSEQKPATENLSDYFPLGPVFVHIKPAKKPTQEFDQSVWNWNDTHYTLNKTQEMTNQNLWLEIEQSAKFLLKLDTQRLVNGKKFLPPDQVQHQFTPSSAVKRVSAKEFVVYLNPGDFTAQKNQLKKMIEEEWKSDKYRVRVEWVENSPNAYTFAARLNETQSTTNHAEKLIHMKKFVRHRTFAHEVGHVLGFDDHYYEVWHDKYCYYTQEYRTTDLMSDAENGRVTQTHWDILNKAYPWNENPMEKSFSYTYGDKNITKTANAL